MKSCPACQRTFPDNSPDACPYDGTQLVSDAAQQQPYYAGGQQAPPQYGAPGNQPPAPQWPPQPPAQNYGGYQQQGQYQAPYGSPYAAPAGGSKILSTLTFVCGLIAFIILVADIVLYLLVRNGAVDISTLSTIGQIMYPLVFYVLPGLGGAGIVLGIVSLIMSGKNPAISKPKAIIGLVLSVISLAFFILGVTNMSS
jgi:hypothetical protein